MELRMARLLNEMTQTELAKKIKVTTATISFYERQIIPVPLKRQPIIEEILGYEIEFNQPDR